MPFVPYDTFSLHSPLQPEEVRRRLAEAVEPFKFVSRRQGERPPFVGKVDGDGFRFTPVVRGRNSFAPLVRGTILQDFDGTRIEGTMSLHPLIVTFVVLWCGGVVFALFDMWTRPAANARLNKSVLGPLLMLSFAWALVTRAFTVEARNVHRVLIEIVQARPAADA